MPRVKDKIGRPPKKINNPDYSAWVRSRLEEQNDTGFPDDDIFPEKAGKRLPEDGGWIMLLIDVEVGRRIDPETIIHIHVPRLTMWFAMPHQLANSGTPLYQAIINHPEGQVNVWPHEYNLTDISKWLDFTEEDGLKIHFLSPDGAFDPEALFYLRSRGIGKADAQRMLLSTLKDPNYCWFEFHDSLRDMFPNGTGTSYFPGRARRRHGMSVS